MRSPHPLALAAGFFTVVPMPSVTELSPRQARQALAWFPVLGALLGALGGGVGVLSAWLGSGPLLAGLLTVVCWQLLTGAMHLDGLADSFDGLAALGSRKQGRDTARALEIMRAPDIGAMGVVAIVLVLGVQVAALADLLESRQLLVVASLATANGRLAILLASRRGVPSARHGGFGALFANTTAPGLVAGQVFAWALFSAALGWWAAGPRGGIGLPAAVLLTQTAAWWWTRGLVRHFGGMTGDIFGALIEVTTAIFLLTVTLALP